MKKPPRNWKDVKCQKILKCGGRCDVLTIKGNHIAVGIPHSIEVYDRNSNRLLHTIGKGQLGGDLNGIAFYDQENILVSDFDNDSIKMFTIQGQHVRTIDRGSTTFEPYGITISPDGHIYVCDDANDCICVFDVNGKVLFSFGSRGSGDECFDWPMDLCFASNDFLHITDVGNRRICIYDKGGKFIGQFTTTYKPWCIEATDCGHLIVSAWFSHKVMVYTTGGNPVQVFGELGDELGQFKRPTGVSVDSDGLIYIADCFNNRIQVF